MVRLSDCRANLSFAVPTQFVGGVYPRQQLSLIASPPGLGKTWLTLRQALDIAQGNPMFGGDGTINVPELRETNEGRALIFCGEAGSSIMAERLQMMRVPLDQIPSGLIVYTLSDCVANGVNLCLDEGEGLQNFSNIVKGEHPDIVFIDTLISFRSDDENASQLTGKLLTSLRQIAVENDCALVIVHHVRKRKIRDRFVEASQDEIIGTSAFTRLTALCLMLSECNFSDTVKLHCVKSWYRKPEPIFFRIDPDGADFVNLHEVNDGGEDNAPIRERVREWIEKLPAGSAVDTATICKTFGITGSEARIIIQRAAEDGIIKLHWQEGRKKFYHRANPNE